MNSIYGLGSAALTNGASAIQSAKMQHETGSFQALLESVQAERQNADTPIAEKGRLNGDYTSGFKGSFTAPADKTAAPSGAAANTGISQGKTIDKTSELYEKSLELESYFVKIMLSAMRSSVTQTSLNGEENSYARRMYEDMLYDELSTVMTKNAGFGLADQIYMQLS